MKKKNIHPAVRKFLSASRERYLRGLDAHDKGSEAAISEEADTSNPYAEETDNWEAWQLGYCETTLHLDAVDADNSRKGKYQ